MDHRLLPMERRHVRGAADVHRREFPQFFLTTLGTRLLRQLYLSIVTDDSAFGFVTEDVATGAVTGVVTGTVEPEGYYKRMMTRRVWPFAWAALPTLLVRPWVVPGLFQRLRFRGNPPPDGRRAYLTVIAVDSTVQEAGLGRQLLTAWTEESRSRGVEGMYLATDADGNDGVNAFYIRCGWVLESTFVSFKGRRMNRYVLDFE